MSAMSRLVYFLCVGQLRPFLNCAAEEYCGIPWPGFRLSHRLSTDVQHGFAVHFTSSEACCFSLSHCWPRTVLRLILPRSLPFATAMPQVTQASVIHGLSNMLNDELAARLGMFTIGN